MDTMSSARWVLIGLAVCVVGALVGGKAGPWVAVGGFVLAAVFGLSVISDLISKRRGRDR